MLNASLVLDLLPKLGYHAFEANQWNGLVNRKSAVKSVMKSEEEASDEKGMTKRSDATPGQQFVSTTVDKTEWRKVLRKQVVRFQVVPKTDLKWNPRTNKYDSLYNLYSKFSRYLVFHSNLPVGKIPRTSMVSDGHAVLDDPNQESFEPQRN